jgi:hypothetical protein
LQDQLFLIVTHLFSLVKAAMNAPRICKLRNGVNKTPQFLNFSPAKGGTKAMRTCQLQMGRVFKLRQAHLRLQIAE